MSETVMIVTGETSGELYGSLLARSLKNRFPELSIIGIGGERMRDAGVELIAGVTSSFGISEVLSSLRAVRETFRKATEALTHYEARVLVLIDYPDFNLRLARKARKSNVKILYYVSPQVWAWRKKRVKKIAKLVDRMAVILPFEEKIYAREGLDCEFVGHPVYDEIREMKIDRKEVRKELGLSDEVPVLSLLPGSRPHEIDKLLPVILEVVREFKSEFRGYQFCVPFAPNTDTEYYKTMIEALEQEGAVINKGEAVKVLSVSDVAVIASGTASLQAALLGIPAVVIYKLFPLTYALGRLLVKVKHISLVNLLSGEAVVKELIQSDVNPREIVKELREIIKNPGHREKMLKAYADIKRQFSDKKASERVAEMVAEMAGLKS
jgi:lipid-A-disaccharide synthase